MHITLSAYQLNSWTDLLEKLLPAALAVASQEDKQFREVSASVSDPVLAQFEYRAL